ncbi:MAG: hypothetical protein J6333_00010 [Planctomycetes bacterium]|nr:hypothetical protein [Planctomycetota bacterium]
MGKYSYDLSVFVGAAISTNDNNNFVRVETKLGTWEGKWGQALGDKGRIAKTVGLPPQFADRLRDVIRSAMRRALNGADCNDHDLDMLEGIESFVVNPSQITLLLQKMAKVIAPDSMNLGHDAILKGKVKFKKKPRCFK